MSWREHLSNPDWPGWAWMKREAEMKRAAEISSKSSRAAVASNKAFFLPKIKQTTEEEDVEHPGRQAVEEKKSIAAYSKVLQREKEVAALAQQLLQLPEKRLKELIEKIKKEIEEGEEVVYPGYSPSKGGKHKKHTKRKYTKKRKTYKK
jgi:hypothetical protein